MLLRSTLVLLGLFSLILGVFTHINLQLGQDEVYWLTFVSSRTGYLDRQIYRMRVDGKFPKQLTFGPQTRVAPAWYPDGKWIGFTSLEHGSTQIYRVDAKGSPIELILTQTTPNTTNPLGSSTAPRFSADGQWMVYSHSFQQTTDIYVKNLWTGENIRITDRGGTNLSPSISPDGKWIAYVTTQYGPPEIQRVRMADGYQERITRSPGDNWYPDWSPDGKWIVFASSRRGKTMQVYKMRADGSDVQQLTFSSGASITPAWSTSGTWIAYTTEVNGGVEIYKMRPDGSDKTPLTNTPGDDLFPEWGVTEPVEFHVGWHGSIGLGLVIGGLGWRWIIKHGRRHSSSPTLL
jgi:Tol biopolymer transport system component